jgi:predicted DNA-binding transcriptional regulator YafY
MSKVEYVRSVKIDYTNWRGERSIREIVPSRIFHGTSDWHAMPQWLMSAWDVEKQAMRDFALKDIHQWFDNIEVPIMDTPPPT